MALRTDLALEMKEQAPSNLDGVLFSEQTIDGIKISRIEITNEDGERHIQKPKGRYVTLETPSIASGEYEPDDCTNALINELDRLIDNKNSVLVCGIGNENITPDALGPKTANKILATRHISKDLSVSVGLGELCPVSVISPGVLGQTGIELGEILLGIIERIKPSLVIAIDALAARNIDRLGTTIQLSDTGIVPGSGVHNARFEISKKTLGVPVLSIGIPTVTDANTLANGVFDDDIKINRKYAEMIVTPREIDKIIEQASSLTAMAINKCLQPHLSKEDIAMLSG